MKTAYTFTVLRYVHDILTGEFANVGVALYAPQAKILDAACVTTYGRVSKFFGGVEGEHFRRMLRHIQAGIEELGERLLTELPFEDPPVDVAACVARVLPPDDSSLQFSQIGGGVSSNLQATLEELYERYVERYADRPQRVSRSDDEVFKTFRRPLAERQVLARLRPKRIVTPDYEHEFPLAWKNEVWHTSEAASFDYADSSDVFEKANRWLGRATILTDSTERFKLYLLLGGPRLEKLATAFIKAKNILNKMPCPHEFINEDDASAFAELVERDLKGHEPS